MQSSYQIFPLGDSAITIDFGNTIEESINKKVLALFHYLQNHPHNGILEAVPAYSTLTLYYDPRVLKKRFSDKTAFDEAVEIIMSLVQKEIPVTGDEAAILRIPVCYENEFAPDMEEVAEIKSLTPEEIINLHTSCLYRVYMLGFLPGFAYMGTLDTRLAISRKSAPRMIEAGSVGIAGRQTGIYPIASPGGWQIIGRTPLRLFKPHSDKITLLNAGNKIEFYSITKDEFEDYQTGGA